ncbi:hypothetical protein OROMI_024667 [Orobanche minor]
MDAEENLVQPDSPRSEVRKVRLESLSRQTVFIQDAVNALYKVSKEID